MTPTIIANPELASAALYGETAILEPALESLQNISSYQRTLYWSHLLMGLSVALVVLTVMVCYTHAELFSIPLQVAGHIIMLLALTTIKLAYLGRCYSLYGLGEKQL